MKTALTFLIILAIAAGMFYLYWLAEKRHFTKTLHASKNWHVSNTENNTAFNFFGTYTQAIRELRDRVPGAIVVHVDETMAVIFFRIPSKS